MVNTIIYDRVMLFKQKFEEHLGAEFDVLPQHFRHMKALSNIPLDRISERLDFMMTEHEFFAGDITRCTLNAFINNFNSFRPTTEAKAKVDEAIKAREMQKRLQQNYYTCPKCGQNVKRSNQYNHEQYICQAVNVKKEMP